MPVAQTSIDHYRTPARSGQGARVMMYIVEHPFCTRQEISKGTGLPINCVCGRVNELLKAELIAEPGKKVCAVTGNKVNALRAEPQQKELFQ